MSKYRLLLSSRFEKSLKKYSRKNKQVKKRIIETLETMMEDPFNRGLRTHKVVNPRFSQAWSSRVTGDLRIIWDFDEDGNAIILLLEIGGHDDVY